MQINTQLPSVVPHSIRFRLPLSYAAIALVTAVAVGAVLLITLRGYYAERELDRMNRGAVSIALLFEKMLTEKTPTEVLQTRLDSIAFFSQARIKLLDADQKVIIESRNNSGINMVSFKMPAPPDIFPSVAPLKLDFQVHSTTDVGNGDTNTLFIYSPDATSLVGVPAENAIEVTKDGSITGSMLPAGEAQADTITMSGGWSSDSEFGDRVFVDGSPYGVRLRPDIEAPRWRSDQVATVGISNSQNQTLGYIQLSDGPAIGAEIVDRVAWALLGASAIAIVVAAAAGWSISRVITTPLINLTHITGLMAQGDLSVRANIMTSDEFGSLGKAFNHMTNQVEHTITTLKCFLADAAHELHTPLTALNTNLELAATETDENARQSFIERALEQLKRLETLTNNLLILSRIETHSLPDERTRVELGALVRETSEMYASQAEQMGITFSIDVPAQPTFVTANEAQIRRSLCNLLDNAIKFTDENGCIELGLRHEANAVKLWVQDTGIGIPNEDMPYLFNRFHRGRNTAAYPGNGLGLAIIKAIIESHHGNVAVDNLSPGTRFTLLLPAVM